MRNENAPVDFETLFPDEREKGENRFQQCHLVMLRMLKILDYLCTKHDIKYFLVAGSLLGAVRHKGFIPWDDDLDVGMTRADYEKFVRYAVPELPEDIFFQSPETDRYFPSCHKAEAKLRDKYSSYTKKKNPDKPTWHHGLMLDVLVYDRAFLPHNFFICATNRLMMKLFWGLKPNNQGNKKRARVLKAISKWTPFGLVYSNMFIRQWNMVKTFGANYFRESEIKEVERATFEGLTVYIPKGWHTYLKRKYGDYMKLPPVEKQVNHHGGLPDAFTPCHHTEVLNWKDRKTAPLSK
jgi:lipopolysaccharide cholinephosphotransferase